MSIIDYDRPSTEAGDDGVGKLPYGQRPLHRLGQVRRLQGVSRRTIARRLGTDTTNIKAQEAETTDIPLSALYRWQEVLQVPIEELLVEAGDDLSPPILKRAQLVRLMKTVAAILQRTQQAGVRRMAQTLVDQLIELMPELREIGPWHAVGQRRTQDELGQVVHRRLSAEALADLMHDGS